MHLLTFLQMLLINIHILDTPIVSFHKYDKTLATDLHGDLQCKSPYRSAARILFIVLQLKYFLITGLTLYQLLWFPGHKLNVHAFFIFLVDLRLFSTHRKRQLASSLRVLSSNHNI